MVLETILGLEIKKPIHLFSTGIFFSSIAILLASSLFSSSPSMVIVAFMTIPSLYVITDLLKRKSLEEVKAKKLKDIFHANFDIVEMYLALFLGMTVGVAFWFSILPSDMLATMFAEQIYNLKQIGSSTAFVLNPEIFWIIAANNIRLVFLSMILSFIFGSGALFILNWNASVIGVAIGMLIYNIKAAGAGAVISLAQGLGTGTAYYILHLVPEVAAYFYAAIAGAFISSAMIRYKPFSPKSNKLLLISGGLIAFSIFLIIAGAFIENAISHSIQSAYS